MIGSSIGHFKILGLFGKGGMGEVDKAEGTKRDRTVALKFLAQELADNTVFYERAHPALRIIRVRPEPGERATSHRASGAGLNHVVGLS